MSEWFNHEFGGPLTRRDWYYLGFIVVLAIFMGAMTPVWMSMGWLMQLVYWMGLPV